MQTLRQKIILLFIMMIITACNNSQGNNKNEAAKARAELAISYLTDGNLLLAKKNLDKALAYDAKSGLVQLAMARYYQLIDNKKLAEQYYLLAIKSRQVRGSAENNYATFLCEIGKNTQAYLQFEKALEYKQPKVEIVYMNMINCAKQVGDNQKEQTVLSELTKSNPQLAQKIRHIIK